MRECEAQQLCVGECVRVCVRERERERLAFLWRATKTEPKDPKQACHRNACANCGLPLNSYWQVADGTCQNPSLLPFSLFHQQGVGSMYPSISFNSDSSLISAIEVSHLKWMKKQVFHETVFPEKKSPKVLNFEILITQNTSVQRAVYNKKRETSNFSVQKEDI